MHRPGILIFCLLFIFYSTISQGSVDHWESLVNANNTWRFFPGTSEPSSTWMVSEFNDGTWSEGPGGFGYGDNDDVTVLSNVSSVYLRIKFSINSLAEIEEAILLADFDDGFIAYINATEIARYGMSGDKPPYNQFADENHEADLYRESYPNEHRLKKSILEQVLVEGENLLAIQVHNVDAASSDLSSNFYFVAGLNVSTISYQPVPTWFRVPVKYSSSNLPIIKIDTKGRSIPDEPKINANIGIIDNGPGANNHVDDPFTDYNGPIGIEMRGSSSQALFPKKQYAVELWTESGMDTAASILGLPIEEDWVLGAPYSDKSLIRNHLTYKLGEDLGWYAPRTRMVEFYLNEYYQGVYMLTEKIKRDENRINISKLNPDENSGDDLTGGYIVKLDKYDGSTSGFGWDSPIPPPGRTQNQVIHFQYHYPKEHEITNEQSKYVQSLVTEFEQALNGPKFRDPRVGYRKYINVESFIDFSIINELSKNVDGYRLSTFLYKDRGSKDGLIYLGPIWDFNLAFGNANYCEGGETWGWAWDFNNTCSGDHWLVPFWWKRLLKDANYVSQLQDRWTELRQGIFSNKNIMTHIDSMALVLDESQKRNYNKWPILNEWIWPNNYVGGTYANEISYLKSWTNNRLSWLDTNIANLKLITDLDENLPEADKLVLIYPNPSNGTFHVEFQNFPSSGYHLKLHDQLGSIIFDKMLYYSDLYDNIFSFNDRLSCGFYVLEIDRQNGISITQKIIVY